MSRDLESIKWNRTWMQGRLKLSDENFSPCAAPLSFLSRIERKLEPQFSWLQSRFGLNVEGMGEMVRCCSMQLEKERRERRQLLQTVHRGWFTALATLGGDHRTCYLHRSKFLKLCVCSCVTTRTTHPSPQPPYVRKTSHILLGKNNTRIRCRVKLASLLHNR